MRFVCEKCRTRYSIPDEKARGRALKVRCKRCENIIVLRPRPAEADEGAPAEITEPKAGQAPPPPEEKEEDAQWYVITGGRQEGPISRTALVAKIVAGGASRRSHVWSERMDDWKRVEDVKELAAYLPEAAPPIGASRRPPAAPLKAKAPASAPKERGSKASAAPLAGEERVSLWSPQDEPLFPAKRTDGHPAAPVESDRRQPRPVAPTAAQQPPRAAEKGALEEEKPAAAPGLDARQPDFSDLLPPEEKKPAAAERAPESTGPHEATTSQPRAAEEAKPEALKAAEKKAKPSEPPAKEEPPPAPTAKAEETPAAESAAPEKSIEHAADREAASESIAKKGEGRPPAAREADRDAAPEPIAGKREEKPPAAKEEPAARLDDDETEIDPSPAGALPVASPAGGAPADPFKQVPDAPDFIEPTVGEMTRFVIAQSGLDEPRSPFRLVAFVGAGLLLLASLAFLFSRMGVNIPIVGGKRGPEKYFKVTGSSNAGLRNQLLGIREDRRAKAAGGAPLAHAARPEMGPLAHKEEQHVEKLADNQRAALAKLYGSAGPGELHLPASSAVSPPAIDRPDAPLTPQQVAETVSHYQSGYGRCIDIELKRNPNFQGGKIRIVTTIMGSGLVQQAEIQSDDPALARRLSGSSLGSCLVDQTRRMVFPSFAGDPFDAELPLVLGASM